MGVEESIVRAFIQRPVIELIDKGVKELPDYVNVQLPCTEINLKGNFIPWLPSDLKNLVRLCLSRNSYIQLPPPLVSAILTYSNLEVLDLSYNSLTDIGTLLNKMPSLRTVNLFGNKLSTIRFEKSKIENMDLGNNNLTQFPVCPETITNLTLDNNKINQIEIKQSLEKLKKLCASNNQMITFNILSLLPILLILDVSYNQLTTLPALSNVVPKLRVLDITSNMFPDIPDLPRTIIELKASYNKLRVVPDFIKSLSTVNIIDFSHNYIKTVDQSQIPTSLVHFRLQDNCLEDVSLPSIGGIEKILCMKNQLSEIPNVGSPNLASEFFLSQNCIRTIKMTSFSKLVTKIDLTNNKLKEIPRELFALQNLAYLFLSGNRISKIPSSIGKSQIIFLAISGNQLKRLPKRLPPTLEYLLASDCNISEIPEIIYKLEDLQELDLSHNHISIVPSLPTVKKLMLNDNELTEFPVDIPECEYLDVSCNKIQQIPHENKTPMLKYLDLSSNQLIEFNSEMKIENLRILKLQFNRISSQLDLSNFPKLSQIDLSSTNVTFKESPPPGLIVCSPEKKLDKNYFIRYSNPDTACGYASTLGIRQLREDIAIAQTFLLNGINLYGIVDGRNYDKSHVFVANQIVRQILEEDDITNEIVISRVAKAVEKSYWSEMKNPGSIDNKFSVPEYAFVLTHKKDAIFCASGNIRALVIGTSTFEVESTLVFGTPQLGVSLNRSYGVFSGPTTMSIGRNEVYSKEINTNATKISLKDGRWLLLLSAAVRDHLTVKDIISLSEKAKDANNFAQRIRDATYSALNCDNITVIVVDLEKMP